MERSEPDVLRARRVFELASMADTEADESAAEAVERHNKALQLWRDGDHVAAVEAAIDMVCFFL